MSRQQLIDKWTAEARKVLVGRKIVGAFYEEDDEMTLLCVKLDDGTELIPAADDEFNGPGSLHWANGKNEHGILPTL